MKNAIEVWLKTALLRISSLKVMRDQNADEMLSVFANLHDDWLDKARLNNTLATSNHFLRVGIKAANARANKYACLALLGFGMIAIEAHALVLYLLPH